MIREVNIVETNEKQKKIVMIVAVVVLLVAAVIIFLYFRSQIRATTMRILRMEGVITLEDDGKEKTATENLRLKSGNALSTATESLVSIGLDESKIVTLDEISRAEFNQAGRKLDLKLTDGSLFFEVQKPLEDDETMDIRTSTMVVGIRGTSGWVSVEGDHESLIVTDGHVHVIGTNPVTGESKEIEVYAGQRIKTYLYNDRSVDSIMFYVEDVTERDLPEFLLDRLRENPELLDKVCKETGWDKPWILGVVTPTPTPTPEPDNTDDNTGGPGTTEEEIPPEELETPEDVAEANGISRSELDNAEKMIIAVDAATGIIALSDGTLFDPVWYAESNPDVVAKYGTSTEALIAHYIKYGKKEGRPPLRPVTPTPTPTPVWIEEKESHSEPEPEPTAAPTPTQAAGPVWYSTGTFDANASSTGAPEVSIANGAILANRYDGTAAGARDGLSIYTGGNIELPVTLDDGVGGTLTFSNIRYMDWDHSGNGRAAQGTYPAISGGDLTIKDPTYGTISKSQTASPAFTATRPDGTTGTFSYGSDALTFLNVP